MPVIAHLAGVLAGLALPVQTEDVVTLKQLTIRLAPESLSAEQKAQVEAFRGATRGINSCADVAAVARKVDGTVFDRADVRVAALPPPVRLLLANAGPDRATVPFGKAPEVRVLIQCGPARKVPIRARPSI